MKSDKMSYVINADIESLITKTDGCANNPENSSTTKIGEHIPCGYSMSTVLVFDNIENKHFLYRGEDCLKKFCESLREHTKNVIDFKIKKNVTVNKRRTKITSRCKVSYICGEKCLKKFANLKDYQKVRAHCHFTSKCRGAAHSICNLRFNVSNEIPLVFHNGSNYDYHFIIK